MLVKSNESAPFHLWRSTVAIWRFEVGDCDFHTFTRDATLFCDCAPMLVDDTAGIGVSQKICKYEDLIGAPA